MSGRRFRSIMQAKLGQDRASRLRFPSEGGRTTRSGPAYADGLATELSRQCSSAIGSLTYEQRNRLVDHLEHVVALAYEAEVLARQRLRIEAPNDRDPLAAAVAMLLQRAEEEGKAGPVAHHLVGAKLWLRFPGQPGLEARPSTAADMQADLPGDYFVEDTVFHVTVAPSGSLFEKCRINMNRGHRVWVLVPESRALAARQMAEQAGLSGRVAVHSIEWFIGQNLEEIAEFKIEGVRGVVRQLIEEYNRRAGGVEGDPSLQIELG